MRLAVLALLLALPAVTQPGGLGRLFFTPEQRAQLEYSYERNATAAGDRTAVLMLNGIVQQHGGARTVWINGEAKNSGRTGRPTAEAVDVPGKPHPVTIKVGQKLRLGQPQATPQAISGE